MAGTYTILVLGGDHSGESFTLPEDGEVFLGRHSTCFIRIVDPDISRHHAKLVKKFDTWFIEPVSQSAGTFLENLVIDGPHALHNTDKIRIGNTLMEFQIEGGADDSFNLDRFDNDESLEADGSFDEYDELLGLRDP